MRSAWVWSAGLLCLALSGCSRARVDLDGLRAKEHVLADGTRIPGETLFGTGTALLLTLDPECPLCLMHAPEVGEIAKDAQVRIIGLYASPFIASDSVLSFAERQGFRFAQVMDAECTIAGALGARLTPEAFLLSTDGEVLYRGAIDDRAQRAGRKKPVATQHYLRDALAAVARGERPARPSVRAVGCFLECGDPSAP